MAVILMTQEAGSRGDEVAAGIAECLRIERVHRHRVERCIAERMQVAEESVRRIFKDKGSLFERWMIDERRLERCLAEEVVRLAAGKGDVLIETGRVTPLFRLVKHLVCVHICARGETWAAAPLEKLGAITETAARMQMRLCGGKLASRQCRPCRNECKNLQYYDLVLNTARVPIPQCVEQVRQLVECPQFLPTPASRAVLSRLSQEAHQRSGSHQVPASESELSACQVIINCRRVSLAGVADNEQAVARIEEHLRGERPSAAARAYPLPPAGPFG